MAWWKSDRSASAWSMGSPADRQVARDAALAYERSAAALPPEDRAQARQLRTDSLEIWRQLAQAEPSNEQTAEALSRAYYELANVEHADGKAREAVRHQRKSLKIARTLAAADPADWRRQSSLLTSVTYLFVVLTEAKQGVEARRYFLEARRLSNRLAEDQPDAEADEDA